MGTRTQIQLLLSNENERKIAKNGTIAKTNIIGNVSNCFEDSFENPKATLEHNYWVLDGQYILPENENSFKAKTTEISTSASTLFGRFTVSLDESIKAKKIIMTYGTYYNYYNSIKQIDNTCNGSRVAELGVVLFLNGQQIYSRMITDTNSNRNYTQLDLGQEYTFDEITFVLTKATAPNRTIKIEGIYFGEIRKFDDELISADLVQETSYLTDTLPIGTLEFEVASANDEFNLLNPDGIFDQLHINAPVRLITQKDENTYDYNTYFLKRWESSNNRITKFYCEDAIGLLQTTEGEYYTNYNLTQYNSNYLHLDDLQANIQEKCQTINIQLNMPSGIDTDLYYRYVLDSNNYRDILQKLYLGFVNYSVICCGNDIKGIILSNTIESEEDIFDIEDVIIDTDVVNRINAVKKIFVNNQVLEPESDNYVRIYDNVLQPGTYEYFFDNPYMFRISSTYSYDTTSNTAKHLMLKVTYVSSNVYIEGIKLNPNALVIVKNNNLPDIEDGSSITVNNYNVKYTTYDFNQKGIDYIDTELINSIANYYNGARYQYVFSTRNLRNPETALGRYIKVESRQGRKIAGNIVKIQTDLFNGLVYTITIDGVLED